MLVDVDRDLIESIAQKKEQTGGSASTVNRMLEIIRAVLNRAHKQWVGVGTRNSKEKRR